MPLLLLFFYRQERIVVAVVYTDGSTQSHVVLVAHGREIWGIKTFDETSFAGREKRIVDHLMSTARDAGGSHEFGLDTGWDDSGRAIFFTYSIEYR